MYVNEENALGEESRLTGFGGRGGGEGELDGKNVDDNQLGVKMTKSPISRDQNQLVKPTAGEPEGY